MIEMIQVIETIVLTLNMLTNTKSNQLVEIIFPRSHKNLRKMKTCVFSVVLMANTQKL